MAAGSVPSLRALLFPGLAPVLLARCKRHPAFLLALAAALGALHSVPRSVETPDSRARGSRAGEIIWGAGETGKEMTEFAAPAARQLVLNHRDEHLQGRFVWAIALTAVVLAAEVAGGLWTHSLALLSDAAHVLMDVVALGLSYVALRLAARDPSDRHSYGLHRAEVLAAVINGGTLLVLAAGIFMEAVRRLQEPQPVKSLEMLLIAAAGLVVNLVVMLVLRGRDHDHGLEDLNIRSAWLHVLGDTLSSVGVIAAGLVMWRTGWTLPDPLMSVAIGAVLLFGAGRLLKSGIHILMEGVPEEVDLPLVAQAMVAVPGAQEVHDLHIWSLCPGAVALSAHVTMAGTSWSEAAGIQTSLKDVLRNRFRIEHTTIQVECTRCRQGVVACTDGPAADAPARL